jgi:hypothetical protein
MPKKYTYKNQKTGNTKITINLDEEQFEILQRLAKRQRFEIDTLLERWIKRLIADGAIG